MNGTSIFPEYLEERAAIIEEGAGYSKELAEKKAREFSGINIQEPEDPSFNPEVEILDYDSRLNKIPEGNYPVRGLKIEEDKKYSSKDRRRYLAYFYVREGEYCKSLVFYVFTARYENGIFKVGRKSKFQRFIELLFPSHIKKLSFAEIVKKFPGTEAYGRIKTVVNDGRGKKKPTNKQYSKIDKLSLQEYQLVSRKVGKR